jgi:hypothetical protein
MSENPNPQELPTAEAPVQSGLISFPEPVAKADQVAVFEDDTAPVDQPPQPNPEPPVQERPFIQMDARAESELRAAAQRDNVARDFTHKVLAARNVPPVVPPGAAGPVPTRIQEQTTLEMEAGRKLVEAHQKRQDSAPRPAPAASTAAEGKMTPVFRPGDYVPDPMKNTGHVGARELSA